MRWGSKKRYSRSKLVCPEGNWRGQDYGLKDPSQNGSLKWDGSSKAISGPMSSAKNAALYQNWRMTFRLNGKISFFFKPCPGPYSTSLNSNCKMVFRTEHDKSIFDLSRRETQGVHTDSTTTRTTRLSDTDLEDLCDEAEASPGRLKRVKIRHSSVWVSSHSSQA